MGIRYKEKRKKKKMHEYKFPEAHLGIIAENVEEYKSDLRERLFSFSVDVIRFLSTLPYKKEYDVLRYQNLLLNC